MSVAVINKRPKPQLNYDPWAVLDDACSHTPDWDDLKSGPFDEFPVFIAGQLRLNRKHNKTFLEGCNNYGKAYTHGNNFIMKRGPNETHIWTPEPLIFNFPPDDNDTREDFKDEFDFTKCGQVEGEIWGVPLRTLARIDRYENNGEAVKRTLQWVSFEDEKQKANSTNKTIRAWLYEVNLDHFMEYSVYEERLLSCNSFDENGKGRIYYFSS